MDDNNILRFSDAESAAAQLVTCAQSARRTIDIFTQCLDPHLYDQTRLVNALSQLARRHRQCQVRLLVRNTQPLHGRQHAVIELAGRLTSKVILRLLTPQASPDNVLPTGFCLADAQHMVFFNDEPAYVGFYRPNASAPAKQALMDFEHQWQHYSQEDPELKRLTL